MRLHHWLQQQGRPRPQNQYSRRPYQEILEGPIPALEKGVPKYRRYRQGVQPRQPGDGKGKKIAVVGGVLLILAAGAFYVLKPSPRPAPPPIKIQAPPPPPPAKVANTYVQRPNVVVRYNGLLARIDVLKFSGLKTKTTRITMSGSALRDKSNWYRKPLSWKIQTPNEFFLARDIKVGILGDTRLLKITWLVPTAVLKEEARMVVTIPRQVDAQGSLVNPERALSIYLTPRVR